MTYSHTFTIDFETFFSKDFSLKKLATLEYIRSPEFEVHGAACKVDDQPSVWVHRDDLAEYLAEHDWDDILAIAHNGPFDFTILFEKYGHAPAMLCDTLGLARALLPQDLDFDLDSLGHMLGFEGKLGGGAALQAVKGLRGLAKDDPRIIALGEYACVDGDRAYQFYTTLYPHLPEVERHIMSKVLRMGTRGRLLFDKTTSDEAKQEAIELRNQRIANAGVDPAIFRSDEKFADLLRTHGIQPPTKTSPKTGKVGYAFSKQDPAFIELLDNPEVAPFVDARLATKSTGDIKRIERLQRITALPPYTLPFPYAYAAAHTHRLGGTGKINVQNLKKGADGRAGKLRMSIKAPPGYVIPVVDASQIELRFNLWFCGQLDLLQMLANGEDLYSHTATAVLKRYVDKTMKQERNFGKVVELGCGYQMGSPKFRATCAIGPMGNPPIKLTQAESDNTIQTYRQIHPFVKAMWDWLGYFAIPQMTQRNCHIEKGPIVFKYERIELPNGLSLLYPNLRCGEDGWVYGINGVTHRIYGGKTLENIIQALARIAVMENLVEIDDHVTPIMASTHDENVGLCLEKDGDDVIAEMIRIMSIAPKWAPGLPLAAEGGYDYVYSK